MKSLFALALISTLFASNAFAAKACIISFENSARYNNKGEAFAQIYINCNGSNPDTRTIELKKPDTSVSDINIATVIAELTGKGYKLVSQTNERWTLINDAP
jgi:hypothetical protein